MHPGAKLPTSLEKKQTSEGLLSLRVFEKGKNPVISTSWTGCCIGMRGLFVHHITAHSKASCANDQPLVL